MTKSTFFLIATLSVMASTTACRGSAHRPVVSTPRQMTDAMPAWYPTPTRKAGVFAGAGFDRSQSLDLAVAGSRLSAEARLAEERAHWLKSTTTRFEEQIGGGDSAVVIGSLTRFTRSVVDEVIEGAQTRDSKVLPTQRGYAVWTLVEQPLAASQAALLRRMQADSAFWIRVRALDAARELQEEVRAYDIRRRRDP